MRRGDAGKLHSDGGNGLLGAGEGHLHGEGGYGLLGAREGLERLRNRNISTRDRNISTPGAHGHRGIGMGGYRGMGGIAG
jgi:hypothetical protein